MYGSVHWLALLLNLCQGFLDIQQRTLLSGCARELPGPLGR